MSIQTSTVPSAWKLAKITPVFKADDHESTENYRPISILPVLSQILEKAIYSQFYSFLEENKLLRDCQFGFRKKQSIKLATTLRCDQIRNHVDKGRMVGCVYLDLSKAFDTISHSSESLNQKIGTGVDKLEHPLYN